VVDADSPKADRKPQSINRMRLLVLVYVSPTGYSLETSLETVDSYLNNQFSSYDMSNFIESTQIVFPITFYEEISPWSASQLSHAWNVTATQIIHNKDITAKLTDKYFGEYSASRPSP
jgi:hypothetical protein